MQIDQIDLGGVTAVAVKGRLDSATSSTLRDKLGSLMNQGIARVVLDFRDLTYISSAGFRTLLIAARAAEEARGRIALCGVAGEVRRLFDIAAFTEFFTILPSREEAVAAVRGEAASGSVSR